LARCTISHQLWAGLAFVVIVFVEEIVAGTVLGSSVESPALTIALQLTCITYGYRFPGSADIALAWATALVAQLHTCHRRISAFLARPRVIIEIQTI